MKRRVFLIVGALTALLALSIAGGAVIAQEATTNDEETTADKSAFFDDFVARVAEILDEDEDTVRSAIETARDETRAAWQEKWEEAHREKLEGHLDAAVEAGKITQDEADEYLTWHDDRPDGVAVGRGFGKHRGIGHHGWRK